MYSTDAAPRRRGRPAARGASTGPDTQSPSSPSPAPAPALSSPITPSSLFPTPSFDALVERNEWLVPYLVLAVALFTRFYRLHLPPGVVFDESHFGRFTNQYTARTYFFDIHPPLGKLVFWAVGKAVGYNTPDASTRPYLGLPSDCRYEHISEEYGPECKYVWLRAVSALHSSLTVLLHYLIARRWTSSVWGGLLASGLLLFDMLNHIEGRLVLMDVQLIFWAALSLYSAIRWWDRLNEDAALEDAEKRGVPAAGTRMSVNERVAWCVWVGFVCGNTFSVKMTGLSTPAVVGLESMLGMWFLNRPVPWRQLLLVLFSGFAIYTFYFAVHFALLTRHGDGDEDFMSVTFQRTILENRHYDPSARWEGFWWNLVNLNTRMVIHNANILEPHPWQSKWWEWVFNTRGVSYYGNDLPWTYTAHMYLVGNHLIHLSVVAALGALIVMGLLYLRYRAMPGVGPLDAFKPFFASATFCLAVYTVNLAPYMGVARSTFIYHYMPALAYGELIITLVLEQLAGPRHMASVTKLYLLAIGAWWFRYTPWIYGFPLTNDAHERRRWIAKWN